MLANGSRARRRNKVEARAPGAASTAAGRTAHSPIRSAAEEIHTRPSGGLAEHERDIRPGRFLRGQWVKDHDKRTRPGVPVAQPLA
jgi:hypothetical protein